MNRRILKEISVLEKDNYLIDNYPCDIYCDTMIKIYLNPNFIVKFKFDSYYPFVKPKVYIIYNDTEYEYINYTHLNYPRYIEQLNFDNIKCFCIDTLMCKDWSPRIQIIDIIRDIKNMKKNISLVIYKSYLRKICINNNIPFDIMYIIFSYL